ncbi:hypothetical protein HDK64DRAFT_275849 [Phyllosticta capitalensis]
MDPASIVGLVEFGFSCAAALSQVVSDIHGGAEDARKLIAQIESTTKVVQALDQLVDKDKSTKGSPGLDLVLSSREEFEQVLTSLRSLLVKAGATVTAKIPSGKFYNIRAEDINRSKFRTFNWARHKKRFDQVTKDLEAVNNSVSVALHVHSINTAHRADDLEQRVRELTSFLQYLEHSGKILKKIVPDPQDTQTPPIASELPFTTSLLGPGPAEQNPVDRHTPKTMNASNDGDKALENEDSASYISASSSSFQNSGPRDAIVARDRNFENLRDHLRWHRTLRNFLEQNERHSEKDLDPTTSTRGQNRIPHILRDQERPGGVALTRSFLLKKTESGPWTPSEWEYPFDELLKRVSRKRVLQETLRAFEKLPQPCRDSITQISRNNHEDCFYWTVLLIIPISSDNKSWIARLSRRESGRTDNVSSVLAVLKRRKQVFNLDRELTTALKELEMLMSSGIRFNMQNERLDQVHEQSTANEILRTQKQGLKVEQEMIRLQSEVQSIGMKLDKVGKQAYERALSRDGDDKALARQRIAEERAPPGAPFAMEVQARAEEPRYNIEIRNPTMKEEANRIPQEEQRRESDRQRPKRPPPIDSSRDARKARWSAFDTFHEEQLRREREEKAKDEYYEKYEAGRGDYRAEERARKARERQEKERLESGFSRDLIKSDDYAKFLAMREASRKKEKERKRVDDLLSQVAKSEKLSSGVENAARNALKAYSGFGEESSHPGAGAGSEFGLIPQSNRHTISESE